MFFLRIWSVDGLLLHTFRDVTSINAAVITKSNQCIVHDPSFHFSVIDIPSGECTLVQTTPWNAYAGRVAYMGEVEMLVIGKWLVVKCDVI